MCTVPTILPTIYSLNPKIDVLDFLKLYESRHYLVYRFIQILTNLRYQFWDGGI